MGKKKFNDRPFAYHQEIELEISTLTNLGTGLGRVKLPDEPAPENVSTPDAHAEDEAGPVLRRPGEGGWVVMVPFTLPGERVRARVFRNHRNFSEADLVSVLTPSPHRVSPPCPVFGRCGGCQYQHLAYAEQLLWKQRQVGELLQHMAGIEFPVAPVIASPRQFGYRSKITPHYNPPRFRPNTPEAPPDFPIGFLRQGTRFDLVDVPRCEIATEGINARLGPARAELQARAAAGAFARGGTLLVREAGGYVTDLDGKDAMFAARNIVAGNETMHSAILRMVQQGA